MKPIRILAVALCLGVVAVGCGDEGLGVIPPPPPPPGPDYKNLSEEWHVLHNMELAYDNRDINRYAELFDADNFVFLFNPDDVGGGVPTQWGYASEITSARNMFNRVPGTNGLVITLIDLTLANNKFEDVFWEDTTLPEFPGETLRQATVTYEFTIETNTDRTYITPTSVVSRAQFIVREIGGKWQLARWFDLSVGSTLVAVPSRSAETPRRLAAACRA